MLVNNNMAVENEVCFPRGSVRPVKRFKRDVSPDNLFGNSFKPPKAKKAKKNNKAKRHAEKDEETSVFNISGTLSYNKVQTGMQILGCIRNIKNLSIDVELPGLTFAKVHITSISDEFTKKMANHLRELQQNEHDLNSNNPLKLLFKPGEIMPIKVLNIEHKENGTVLESTIHPTEINSGLRLDSFSRNMLLWGSIQSELDHGYEINAGLKNCRVFLPFTNVDEGIKYEIGKPIWCVIHKSECSNAAAILRVSAKKQHLLNSKVEEIRRLDEVTVGMQVDFQIDKVTNTGIHGKFSDNYTGYIDETQLKTPSDTLQNYNETQIVSAFILFVEPATKIAHLTLRNFHTEHKPKLQVGDLVTGTVCARTTKGIYLKFPSKEKGFITNRRLLNSLKKPSLSINVTDIIRIKYPNGGKHRCRILDYSQMLREYVCTVEPDLVRNDTITANNLTIGQLVKVRVDDIKPDGLVVSTGNTKGFVANLHLSNSPYTENIKKKFYIGLTTNARVHNIVEDNILFTLKPAFVESKDCLSDPEAAVIGKSYPGMVVNTSQSGALIVFYGNAKGWIDARQIKEDPIKYFFYGQIATFCIKKKGANDKLKLTLTTVLSNDARNHLYVGKNDAGIIEAINEKGIEVRLKKDNIPATVPIYHLSTNVELCAIMASMYKIGDELENLLCVRTEPLTFSRRESQALDRGDLKLFKFNQLKVGLVLRCSYIYKTKHGIFVYPLLRDYTEKVLIKCEDLDDNERVYQPHECIAVKVIECDQQASTLRLSAKLVDVYNSNSEYSIKLFVDCLKEMQNVMDFGKMNNWPICDYSPGEKVCCKVEKIGEQGGCVVKLPNNVNGLVVPQLCTDKMKSLQILQGVCLSYDFQNNCIDVCLKKHYLGRINAVQNGKLLNDSLMFTAEKLVVKDKFLVAVLHGNGNRQLIYIPLYLHENDTKGSHEFYAESKFKVCLCGRVGSVLVGISKRLFKKLEHDFKREKRLGLTPKRTKRVVSEKIPKEEPIKIEEPVEEVVPNESIVIVTKQEKNETVQPLLPGITSFYGGNNDEPEESSSDDDEEEQQVRKKRKLTPAERAELARQEEERLSKIEKELADANVQPQSADQFDRLLLANPNSSVLWTRYISFHISLTELEKARTVGKRALEAIDLTLTQERFNIWIALLHLENLYGTTESFGNLFDEAVRCNDSLQVYLKVIEMLAESGKVSEMEEKIRKVRSKHKQNVDMWLELGRVYYMLKNFKEARNMKNTALKSIADKKAQLNLIVRFAIMEFKLGEADQGAAIFETIISTDPKKVNIWSTYVDQLVKRNEIDQARKVLDRAVGQRLPLKCMKSLFMKYRKFEEEHGTEQSVELVKERAKEYITKYTNETKC